MTTAIETTPATHHEPMEGPASETSTPASEPMPDLWELLAKIHELGRMLEGHAIEVPVFAQLRELAETLQHIHERYKPQLEQLALTVAAAEKTMSSEVWIPLRYR